ncbi:hypothetical protein JTB14_002206 [Gonioctena quinquepunctata]|nr:hypothetical protein JTB14_002206 [Gonioctena quinquepunctata]
MNGSPPPGGVSENPGDKPSNNRNIGIYVRTHDDDSNHNVDRAAQLNTTKDGTAQPNNAGNRSVGMETDTKTSNNTSPRFFNLGKMKNYDEGNIYVFIEKTNENQIGKLHPMCVGHILHKVLNVKGIIQIRKAGSKQGEGST